MATINSFLFQFDLSPFCLRWKSRQYVFVFFDRTRAGGPKRSESRTGFVCLSSSPYTSPDDPGIQNNASVRGGRASTNKGKTSSADLHMHVSVFFGRESSGVTAGKVPARRGGPRPGLLPVTPTSHIDSCREMFRHSNNIL